MFNSRDAALALVEEGLVSAEQMLSMCLRSMSTDDVAEMVDAYLDLRRELDEYDGQPDEAQEWYDFDPDC